MARQIRRTHHLEDRAAAARLEMKLEAQGLSFQTFHEPWDFEPYRVTITLTTEESHAFHV